MRFQTELLLLLCSTLLPSSCALSTEKFDALIEWMSEHPGFESRVRMGENEDGFRGIFVKDDMKEGEVIFSVPVSTALNIGGYDTANSEVRSFSISQCRLLSTSEAMTLPTLSQSPTSGFLRN
eukprot:gene14493-20517_t